MLKTFRIISALIVIALALSGMFTNALITMPYMLIALYAHRLIYYGFHHERRRKTETKEST